MEKEIKLYNRDHADLKLKNVEGNKYVFDVDKEHEYVLTYMRTGMGKKKKDDYWMVDPSGGPYIETDSMVNGKYHVDRIYNDERLKAIVLELSEKNL